MRSDPDQAAADIALALSSLATGLFEADSSPDIAFVRAQAAAGNRRASQIADELAALWQEYALAKDASEALAAAMAAGSRSEVERLLGPSAITLPSGSSSGVGALAAGMQRRLDAATSAMAQLAASARQALTRLDATTVEAGQLFARATTLGADDDPEITRLRTALDAALAAVAADPSTDPAALTDKPLAAARSRVEEMERQRGDLPQALAQARALVGDIERLVAKGAADFALASQKIAPPAGLVAPLNPHDAGLRGLGPHLDRIDEDVASGAWDKAAFALAAWQKTAQALHADARRVADANAAPVARRNELRGQLQGFRSKSLALGHGEHPALDDLHEQAQHALHVAPCDLPTAERLVRDYISAVNSASTGGTR